VTVGQQLEIAEHSLELRGQCFERAPGANVELVGFELDALAA